MRGWACLTLATLAGVSVLFALVPHVPSYERGFIGGALVVAAIWLVTFRLWVGGGLGFRLAGVWAEDAVLGECRQHDRVFAVVPSLKTPRGDIDLVLVTTCAVYVVEVKWRYRKPSDAQLYADYLRMSYSQELMRSNLSSQGLPAHCVRRLLVIAGPGGRRVSPIMLGTALSTCRVVSARGLGAWLDEQTWGPIGPDYADGLGSWLGRTALEADRELELSWGWRLLARVR